MMTQFDQQQAQRLTKLACRWGEVIIYQDSDHRWLVINDGDDSEGHIHSAMNRATPWQPVLPYFYPMLASLLFVPQLNQVAILGLGGGELPRFFLHGYPHCSIDIIDNEALMWQLYQQYFQLNDDDASRCRFITADVCQLSLAERIEEHKQGYDLLFIDVVDAHDIPQCLLDHERLQQLAQSLSEEGMLTINLLVHSQQHALSVMAILRQAFAGRILFMSVGAHMNIVALVFARPPIGLTLNELRRRADQLLLQTGLAFHAQVDNLSHSNPLCDTALSFV